MIDIIQVKGNTSLTVHVNNQIVISILKHKLPYPISYQKFNYYIKEISERAGIDEVVPVLFIIKIKFTFYKILWYS